MKNNGEEAGKLLVMDVADENKKAAENKIYKLPGSEQNLLYIFYFLPLSCGQLQP